MINPAHVVLPLSRPVSADELLAAATAAALRGHEYLRIFKRLSYGEPYTTYRADSILKLTPGGLNDVVRRVRDFEPSHWYSVENANIAHD